MASRPLTLGLPPGRRTCRAVTKARLARILSTSTGTNIERPRPVRARAWEWAMSGVIALGWVAAVAASMFFKQMSRLVGRQKVTLWLVLQAAGFLLGGLLVLATLIVFRRPQALIGAVGGLGVGLAIAGLGLSLTTVERRPDGEY